ncbi:MAG TPA: RNA polymerase sigma-70 factor [Gemmatimonadaceae bacterium]|nr:RNA polymerase sigma-70 factor [Gemmatimonadaceae bacterium]
MDSTLVERIRAGDDGAFEAMFRDYYERLCLFTTGLVRSPETAEEIVQEVFLNIWTNRHGWQVRSGIAAYLYGAARNRALNHLQHLKVERLHEERTVREAQAFHAPGVPAADDVLLRQQTAEAVRAAIEQLPERARLAVTLRWQHQLRHAEIAEVMGISVKGVENQLARALVMLRRHLRPDS